MTEWSGAFSDPEPVTLTAEERGLCAAIISGHALLAFAKRAVVEAPLTAAAMRDDLALYRLVCKLGGAKAPPPMRAHVAAGEELLRKLERAESAS